MKFFTSIISLFSLYYFSTTVASNDNYELELLQLLFRHGDRVPNKKEIYKSDPHNPKEYADIGYGQLTEAGMRRMYKFGQALRKNYSSFLGDYRFNKVYAYSSENDRVKVSLQAVLGGLYDTPITDESCNKDAIKWLQIPTHYDKTKDNFLSSYLEDGVCPIFSKLIKEADNAPEIRARYKKYNSFLKHLSNSTGDNITDAGEVWKLYNNLMATRSMNLRRPNWLTDEGFNNIRDLKAISLGTLSHLHLLRKIIAGPIIKKLLSNIESNNAQTENTKVKGDGGKKIYLYSGQEHNVATFVKAHNFTGVPKISDFGSGVIVEKLRGKDDKVYIRMFYWDGMKGETIPLKFGDIGEIISLDSYKNMVSSLLPQPDDCFDKNPKPA